MYTAMLIYIVSLIIWMIPPIRQYKGNYFYFFITLAIMDPLSLIFLKTFKIMSYNFYAFASLIVILSLLEKETIKRYLLLEIIGLISIGGIILTKLFDARIILIIESLIISFIVLTKMVSYFTNYQRFNPFHIVLLFYVLSLATKYLFFVIFGKGGYMYFFITNAFEFIFAIYFSIVKGHDTKDESSGKPIYYSEPQTQ